MNGKPCARCAESVESALPAAERIYEGMKHISRKTIRRYLRPAGIVRGKGPVS
jgi:hypothetical protein